MINAVLISKKNNHFLSKNLAVFCGGLLYFFVLCYAYHFFVVKYYAYMGFFDSFNTYRFWLSILLISVIQIIIPKREKDLPSFFLTLQNVLTFIPMSVFYTFNPAANINFYLLISGCFVLQIILIKILWQPNTNNYIKSTEILNYIVNICLIFGAFIVLLSAILVRIPTFKAFDILGIYELRGANEYGSFLGYTSSWTAKAILPFTFIYCLDKKHYKKAIIAVILILLLYMIYIFKTHLFIPVLLLGVYIFCKSNKLIRNMYYLPILGVVACMLVFYMTGNLLLPSLFVRRVLMIPAQLKFVYYEFFSVRKKVYFADGVIGSIFNIISPYEEAIPKTIGAYLGEGESNANTGYWGDAYANAGVLGVILFSVILALMIIILAKLGRKINPSVVVASMTFSLFSLNDGALLTNILTGGMFIFFIIFYFGTKASPTNIGKNGTNNFSKAYLEDIRDER